MRYFALAFVASALVACGGGDKGSDTAAAGDTAAAAGAGSGPVTTQAGTASPAPATGQTHEVRMIGDDKGYRFEPANITIKAGDAIRWVMVSGGPHDVNFDEASVPQAAQSQLSANIPNSPNPAGLQSEMLINPDQNVTISFANVAPGTYNYVCTPHEAMGMKGVVTVQ